MKFLVTEYVPNQQFVDVSSLPLTQLIFTHILEPSNGKLLVTHKIEMKGMLSPLFAMIIGRKMKAGLPDAMRNLIQLAEQENK